MGLIRLLLLLAAFAALTPGPCPAQQLPPQDAGAQEADAVRDRLLTSLFFRGEAADAILDSGHAGRYIDLSWAETHAEAREALIEWLRKNPKRGAEIYLSLKRSGGRPPDVVVTTEIKWRLNPAFLASVKALNEAAGSSSVSREAMELASRRLYEGPLAQAEDVTPVTPGGGGTGGARPAGGRQAAPLDYAGFRLDKGALEAELARAAGWMDSARLAAARPGMERAYAAAFAVYQEFLVAAAALKGRGAVTERESARLEELRAALRAALGRLSLRSRAAALADAGAALGAAAGEPGAAELLAELGRARAELERLAELGEAGRPVPADEAARAEDAFAGLYLGYTAYDGLLNLKRRAGAASFSCLLDYAAWRWLAARVPGSAYPRARSELASAAGRLDSALALAGTGDFGGALAGLDAAALEGAAATVASSSAFYRAAQFFNWGLLFRPLELKVAVKNGRPSFRPALTLSEVVTRK